MTGPRTPLDTALDVVVFAPLGLALTVGEEVPRLAAKGRARVTGQLAAARVLGRLAVAQGRREADRRFGAPAPPASQPAPVPARPASARAPAPDAPSAAGRGPAGSEPAAPRASGPQPGGLAIPGYDSLSASQVVQRLAGLSREELAAVAAYESSHRGRRTILARAAQLQAS